ncbi:MAG: C10 family peptidase, partial [Bacteroidales bacterium]|nr:C10 family peptidase [Bacteroidales bacterium]
MRKHVLFFVFLLIAAFAGAQSVSLETAEQVAKNFWLKKQGTSVTLVQDQSVSDVKGIYIFNNANGKGFVIVSDNENARPILGYSFENDFSNGTTPTNAHEWLKKYDSSNRPETTNVDNQNKWKALKNYKPNDGASLLGTEKSIEPIVKCTWYQRAPYYNDCPKIGEETTLTGCVATAIGQILKTYEFPKQGYGSHTYTHPTIGELSTTMTKYNWNNIKESYTGEPGEDGAEDVAALLYQIGVALEMNYGVVESSSSTMVATVVLQDYFQCKTNTIHYEFREDFDYEAYKSQILADLIAGRPMLYGGVKSSTGGGHQFILDGYEYDDVTGDMFHINYGWGGSSNGNYTLDELIYDKDQDVVFGIEPDKSLWVNKHRFDMPSVGGDITLAVRSQYDYKGSASISTNAEWLTLSTTTAVGDGEFTEVVVTATANTTGRERSAVITIVQNGETETVTINQLPGSGIAGWYGEFATLNAPSDGFLKGGKEIIILPERYGTFAAGQQLLAVSFVTFEDDDANNPFNNKDFTIKIYEDSKTDWRLDNAEYTKNVDACLGTLVYSQDYTATEFGTQEVKLDEPYVISGKNFWIALELKGNTAMVFNDNTIITNVCAGPSYFDLSRKRIYEKNASGTQINTNIYNYKISTADDGTIYYEKYNKNWKIGFYVTDGENNEMPIALADNANIQVKLLNSFANSQLAPSLTELSASQDLILYPRVRNIGPLDITEVKKVQSIITAGDKVINTYLNPWDWPAEDTWYQWFAINDDRTFIITADMFNENLLSGTFDVCFNVDYIDQPDVLAADNTYCITVTREVPEFTVEVVSANDKQGSARALTDNATYTLGASVTAIASPETGYKFVKWTIDEEEVSTDAEYTFTATRNVNIQAIFEPLQYTVNVVVGENGTVEGAKTYNYGENATVTISANEGYKFVGFENIDATEPTLTFIVTNDTTFTAVFKKILNVTASANVDNAGTVTVNPEGEILEGDEVTVTATVNKGYNFVNWMVGDNEVSDNPEYTFNVTDNIALVANFEPIQYTVNVVVGENGTVTGDGIYNFGENATVTVTANEGYKFVGFENIETTEPTLKFTVTNDTTFTAIFKKILNVTAVANVENAGTVTVTPEGEILEGDEVTVTAVASKSYVFVGYENIEGNESTLKFTATKDTSFTAIFKRILNITAYVTVEGTGTVTISPKGQIIEGDEVTVTAAPSEGYVFAGFDKIEGTETTLNFIATKDTSFTVNFKKILNIAVSVNDKERGFASLSPEGQIIEGDEVTLTATANEGFVFNYWESNDEIISTDATYTFVASTSTTYIAVFDEKLPDSFVVSASTNNSTFGTVSGTGQYELNANVELVATANEGYKFVNWTDADGEEVSTEATYSFAATADVELTANFEAIQCVVTITFEGEGTVTGDGTYNYGDEVTITATPAEHNELKFWLDGQLGDMVSTDLSFKITVTSDTTIHAVFVSTLCQIDTYTAFGGTTSGDGAVYKGDEITITAIADEG